MALSGRAWHAMVWLAALSLGVFFTPLMPSVSAQVTLIPGSAGGSTNPGTATGNSTRTAAGPANATGTTPVSTGSNQLATVIPPLPAFEANGVRYFVIQIQIIEVDERGNASVVARPTLRTTGAATGTAIEPTTGRKLEFHFAATEPGAPTPLPALADGSARPATGSNAPLPPGTTSGSNPVTEPIAPAPGNPAGIAAATAAPAPDLARRLNQTVSVQAVSQSRLQILRDVAQQAGLRVVIEPDTAVTHAALLANPTSLQLENAPLQQALKTLTEPLRLSYTLRNEWVVISTSANSPAGSQTHSGPPDSGLAPSSRPGSPAASGNNTTSQGSGSLGSNATGSGIVPNAPGPAAPPATQPGMSLATSAPLPTDDWHVRIYAVSDLVTKSPDGQFLFEELIRSVQKVVTPKEWIEHGGAASVKGFQSNGSLVIRQSSAGHAAVEKYLDTLRRPVPDRPTDPALPKLPPQKEPAP